MLPTPNIPECQKDLNEGSHRRHYTWSRNDDEAISAIVEVALPEQLRGRSRGGGHA